MDGKVSPNLGQLLRAKIERVPVEYIIDQDKRKNSRDFAGNPWSEVHKPSSRYVSRAVEAARSMGVNEASIQAFNQKLHTGEKKMSLSQSEVNMLVTLADRKNKEDELSKYTAQVPSTLSADLQELMQEEMKENSKRAARTILGLLKKADAQTENDVAELRRLRQQEKTIKARIEARNRAKMYGNETQNYLPLTDMVEPGSLWDVRGMDGMAMKVPENWAPATPATPAAEAAK